MSALPGPASRVNTFATVSIIAAIVVAPVGIVFGILALRQIRQTGERGRSLALAGLWIGIAVTVLYVLVIVFVVAIVGWSLSLVADIPPEVLR